MSNANYLNKLSINILKSNNYPIILNQNGVFYPSWYPKNWKKKNQIMAEIYHKADYVFWQSNFCRKSADYFLGTRNLPGEILYNSVDTKYIFPKADHRQFILITGKFTKMFYRIEILLMALLLQRNGGNLN